MKIFKHIAIYAQELLKQSPSKILFCDVLKACVNAPINPNTLFLI